MSWFDRTVVFSVFVVAIIAVYDALAWAYASGEGTISRVLLAIAYEYPLLPFAVGVVAGHIFWANEAGKKPVVVQFLFDHPFYFLVIGLWVGSTFWPLYKK